MLHFYFVEMCVDQWKKKISMHKKNTLHELDYFGLVYFTLVYFTLVYFTLVYFTLDATYKAKLSTRWADERSHEARSRHGAADIQDQL